MKQNERTKEELLKRRDEINAQLNRVNDRQEIRLDNDLDQQAIEMEQHEVSVTMEKNLQKELAEIEFDLAEIENA